VGLKRFLKFTAWACRWPGSSHNSLSFIVYRRVCHSRVFADEKEYSSHPQGVHRAMLLQVMVPAVGLIREWLFDLAIVLAIKSPVLNHRSAPVIHCLQRVVLPSTCDTKTWLLRYSPAGWMTDPTERAVQATGILRSEATICMTVISPCCCRSGPRYHQNNRAC
jgi:hypothetical protein